MAEDLFMRFGEVEFSGQSLSVIPLKVTAVTPEEALAVTERVFAAIEAAVGEVDGAEVIREAAGCLGAVEAAAVMYRAVIQQVAAKAARGQ